MFEDKEFVKTFKKNILEIINKKREDHFLKDIEYDYFLEKNIYRAEKDGLDFNENNFELFPKLGIILKKNGTLLDICKLKSPVDKFDKNLNKLIKHNKSFLDKKINSISIILKPIQERRVNYLYCLIVLLENIIILKEIGFKENYINFYGKMFNNKFNLAKIIITDRFENKICPEFFDSLTEKNNNSFFSKILIKNLENKILVCKFFISFKQNNSDSFNYNNLENGESNLVLEIKIEFFKGKIKNNFEENNFDKIKDLKIYLNPIKKPNFINDKKFMSASKIKRPLKSVFPDKRILTTNKKIVCFKEIEKWKDSEKRKNFFREEKKIKKKSSFYIEIISKNPQKYTQHLKVLNYKKFVNKREFENLLEKDLTEMFEKNSTECFSNLIDYFISTNKNSENKIHIYDEYESDFTDLIFITHDRCQIKAHKMVLSKMSKFFKKILKPKKGNFIKKTFDFNKISENLIKEIFMETFQSNSTYQKIILPVWLHKESFDIFLQFCYKNKLDDDCFRNSSHFINLLKFIILIKFEKMLYCVLHQFLENLIDSDMQSENIFFDLLKFFLNQNLTFEDKEGFFIFFTYFLLYKTLDLPKNSLGDLQSLLLKANDYLIEDLIFFNYFKESCDINLPFLLKLLCIKKKIKTIEELIIIMRIDKSLTNSIVIPMETINLKKKIKSNLKENKNFANKREFFKTPQKLSDQKNSRFNFNISEESENDKKILDSSDILEEKEFIDINLFNGMFIEEKKNIKERKNYIKKIPQKYLKFDNSYKFKIGLKNAEKNHLYITKKIPNPFNPLHVGVLVKEDGYVSILFYLPDKKKGKYIENKINPINLIQIVLKDLEHNYEEKHVFWGYLSSKFLFFKESNYKFNNKDSLEVNVMVQPFFLYSCVLDYFSFDFKNINPVERNLKKDIDFDFLLKEIKICFKDLMNLEPLEFFNVVKNPFLKIKTEKELFWIFQLYIEKNDKKLRKENIGAFLNLIKFDYMEKSDLFEIISDSGALSTFEGFKEKINKIIESKNLEESPRIFGKKEIKKRGSINLFQFLNWFWKKDHHSNCTQSIKKRNEEKKKLKKRIHELENSLAQSNKKIKDLERKNDFLQNINKKEVFEEERSRGFFSGFFGK